MIINTSTIFFQHNNLNTTRNYTMSENNLSEELIEKPSKEVKKTFFPMDYQNPRIVAMIEQHKGNLPDGFIAGHPVFGLILWAGVVAGSIPVSIFYAYQKDGIKAIPQGVLNGIMSATGWTLYLPTLVTLVFGQIPVGVVDIVTMRKMNLIGRKREFMYKTLYSMGDKLKKLNFYE